MLAPSTPRVQKLVKHPLTTSAAFALVVSTSLTCGSACQRQPEPEGRPVPSSPKPAPAPAAPATASPSVGAERHLAWSDPPGWSREAGSPMRLATYRVPAAKKGDEAEMSVSHFGGGQGGAVDANFTRWTKQFENVQGAPRKSTRTANGLTVHILEIESGSFTAMNPAGGPAEKKEGYGLVGAIVDTDSGPYFFKLTGPKETLKSARDAFFTMLDGVKLE